MTALLRRLIQRIAAEGPISVAEYMAQVLLDPRDGYYVRADPLGRAGDFTTAPEISQMFGELLGLWCVDAWSRLMGSPTRFALAELGPGRGTLMADALRAAQVAPGFLEAAEVHLVEASPALRAKQRQALAGRDVQWHGHLDAVPDLPILLLANEFFDALPVRQFVRTERGMVERMVGLDPAGDALRFGLAPGPGPWAAALPPALREAPLGSLVEYSPASIGIVQAIARRIVGRGGAALLIDYGSAESGPGETLQAVRRHDRHGVLDDPGAADLSARVDFAALAKAASDEGVDAFGPVPQGTLLERLGIAERARMLAQAATSAQAAEIERARARLIGGTEMGTLFKALALAPRGRGVPAGFADGERRI
ncbi:MAG: SAM-dependent methyltransferase [Alphaproteobacteria bacterium]|nr:SAM-dependent methyltransferase [Alphaproteobacteria bacterium]